jgi:hypothetical protein
MSKAETLLDRLLKASRGVSTPERQAEARVKTNDYFKMDKKELKDSGLAAVVTATEDAIKALRAEADAAGNVTLVEVYDASLTVFTKWTSDKEAA